MQERTRELQSLYTLQDHKRYFLQLATDPLNSQLLTKCVNYFDKLIEMWASLGVVLVTQSDRDRSASPNNSVYIYNPTKPARMLVLGSQGVIVSQGTFVNRSSEIVGVTSFVRDSPIVFEHPYELMIIFQEDRSDSRSRTFVTYSQSAASIDARPSIVLRMAHTLLPFIQDQVFMKQPGQSRSYSKQQLQLAPIIHATEHNQSSIVTEFLINHLDMTNSVAKSLLYLEVRSQYQTAAYILEFMRPGSPHSGEYLLNQIYNSRIKQRDIVKPDQMQEQTLRMRNIKQLFINQFGYDRKVALAQTLSQLQQAIPPNIYQTLERTLEIRQHRRKQATTCTHTTRHNIAMLLTHYLDLSNPRNAEIVQLTIPPSDLRVTQQDPLPTNPRSIQVPIDFIPCLQCSYDFICGHRLAQIVHPDNPDALTKLLTPFVMHTPQGFSYCGVCGSVIELAKFEPVDITRVSQQELIELGKKSGFTLCQQLTNRASKFLTTNLQFQPLYTTLYIYKVIYPYIKNELRPYKQTFEYKRRLIHATAIGVAAFFNNLQESTRVSFDLHGFYNQLLNTRTIIITNEQFMAQIQQLSSVDIFRGNFSVSAPSFEELFNVISSKPMLRRYFDAVKVTNIAGIVSKFAHKQQDGSLVVKISDIYKAILSALKSQAPELKNKPDYHVLLRTNTLHIFLTIQAMGILRDDDCQFIHESQSHIQSITLPRMQTLFPPRIKTSYLNYRVNESAYPDPSELYPRLFYRRYCPKATYATSASGIDSNHQFGQGTASNTCTLCGFDAKNAESEPHSSNIQKHYSALVTFKPASNVEIQQLALNTNAQTLYSQLLQQYSHDQIAQALRPYDATPVQILNLGMFDYIGYEYGVRRNLQIDEILTKMQKFQSTKFHKSYELSHETTTIPADLKLVRKYQLDWGCFRSRFARIEGFMRQFLFQVKTPDGMLQSFSILSRYMTRAHRNFYLHSQLLIYYFFCVCLPQIADMNTLPIINQLILELCERDRVATISTFNKNHFHQFVGQDRDMRVHNDDKFDESAEVLGEDEQSDKLA